MSTPKGSFTIKRSGVKLHFQFVLMYVCSVKHINALCNLLWSWLH